MTLIWIGGNEHFPAVAPTETTRPEYNFAIDPLAARIVFGDTTIPIWQVPESTYRQALVSLHEFVRRLDDSGELGSRLTRTVTDFLTKLGMYGIPVGDSYALGDNPLVLLTALRSIFDNEPSSSEYRLVPRPRINENGSYTYRDELDPIRVYTKIDVRLMLDDLYAKLSSSAP